MKWSRLDQELVNRHLVASRRQAISLIKFGSVFVDNKAVTEIGTMVAGYNQIVLVAGSQYVSRAALKLDSVAEKLKLNFNHKSVMDVGSSTGGFSDYALQHGAKKVVAIDIGTNQLHPNLRQNPKIELHEKTDIRNFKTTQKFDVILVDVSFVSLRDILPYLTSFISDKTEIIVMLKPQFESHNKSLMRSGIIKNDRIRRAIFKDFESWLNQSFIIINKADSDLAGTKGNLERFYRLKNIQSDKLR